MVLKVASGGCASFGQTGRKAYVLMQMPVVLLGVLSTTGAGLGQPWALPLLSTSELNVSDVRDLPRAPAPGGSKGARGDGNLWLEDNAGWSSLGCKAPDKEPT